MTAIAGVVVDGVVWLAGDSRVGNDETCVRQAAPKVVRIGATVVGGAGSTAIDRVMPLVDWDAVDGDDQDLTAEILRVAESIGVELDATDEFLIGRGGRLLYFSGMSTYEAGEHYGAIGSGCQVCLGFLNGTRRQMPQRRVIGAVAAAIAHVPSCGGPITWVRSE